MIGNPVATPSNAQLERHIRTCALDTANVFLTKHAIERMQERGATPAMVYEVLQSGLLTGVPEPSIKHTGVVCRMQRCVCGENWVVCASVEYPQTDLVVVTVYELEVM